MDTFMNKLTLWIDQQIESLPEKINLAYLEYNNDGFGFTCVFFGYMFIGTQFDPEDASHLRVLPHWQWEGNPFKVQLQESKPKNKNGTLEAIEIIEEALNKSKELRRRVQQHDLMVIYGLHDALPKLFRLQGNLRKVHTGKAEGIYFYELSFDYSGSHSIEKYELRGIDEESLFVGHKIEPYPTNYSIQLDLKEGGKLKDLLRFYRGWLVCSTKLVNTFKKYTSSIQTFPVVLRRCQANKEDLIEGYYAVNLYDKIDCIDPKWLALYSGDLTFDPSKGYKVLSDKVKERDVFRVSVYDYRLLVSQRVRDDIESQKITGISWIKREVE